MTQQARFSFKYGNEYLMIDGEHLSVYSITNHPKTDSHKATNPAEAKAFHSQDSEKEFPPITHVTLFVSQKCNLQCVYCYGDGGQYGSKGLMTTRIAIGSVDWLLHQSKAMKNIGFTFFGGEPLLNFPLIKDTVDYATKQAAILDKEVEFGITTNATLLNSQIIDFFEHHNINPVVSFDGIKEIQDRWRPYKRGEGSYDNVLPRIKELLHRIPNSVCRATLVDSADYNRVEEALQKIGFRRIQLTVASKSLFNNLSFSDRNVGNVVRDLPYQAEDIIDSIERQDTENLKRIKRSGLGWHIFRMIEQFVNQEKRYFSCGAGRTGVAISTMGEVYLCHRFVGMDDYILGNIFDNKLLRDPYQTSPTRLNNGCQQCFAKYFCAGGCYHDNVGITGSVFVPAPDMCELMRALTQNAGIIVSKLGEKDLTYLVDTKLLAPKVCVLDLF